MQPTFAMQLTADQLNLIGQALGKLPYEQVAELINSLRAQYAAAVAPPPSPAPSADGDVNLEVDVAPVDVTAGPET